MAQYPIQYRIIPNHIVYQLVNLSSRVDMQSHSEPGI